ncbi:MAG: 6-bladed beta-propeller, partial [Gemmatimonadetes bacterium]|nr:6-bladed beta-propeller [Gemmatimonadota bacterium]
MSTTSRDARRPSTTSLARLALVTAGVAFPLLAMSSCGRAAAPAGVARTDSAGVEIVTNAGPDHPLGWSLDSVLSLRSPSGQGGDTIGFLAATDVAVLGDRIIVLDASTPALFVYDTLGNLEGRYGRKGNGPGELMMPGNVTPAPGGGVGVLDLMNRRIERFDVTMAPSGSISLRNVRLWGGGLGFTGDVPVLPERRVEGDVAFLDLVALGPTDTTVIATLRQPPGKNVELKSCGMGFTGMPPIFSPMLAWT